MGTVAVRAQLLPVVVGRADVVEELEDKVVAVVVPEVTVVKRKRGEDGSVLAGVRTGC